MKLHQDGDPNMNPELESDLEFTEPVERVTFDFGLSRRSFVQVLGAGLLITVSAPSVLAQSRGRRGRGRGREVNVAARIHIGAGGPVTVLTGKVEMGQGARAELSQAAAEELRLPVSRIHLLMADTGLVPDDGITAGSRSTPSTVPAVRRGAAAAREILQQLAAAHWKVEVKQVRAQDGQVVHEASQRTLSFGELARLQDLPRAFAQTVPRDIELTPVKEWRVLGQSVARPNRRDLVTGAHQFPSDIVRPGMLYGKILRPPSYGAKLTSIDLAPAKALAGVVVVRDDQFVGVAAPTTFQAQQALEALAKTARWAPVPHPSSREVFDYLRQRVSGGVPKNPFDRELAAARKVLKQTYHAAYVQHAPLEPRVAVAEWQDGALTVWTGTQNPFGFHRELARAFKLTNDRVRVIVPDFGSGFGGKHTGEVAVEAARLAQAAKRPVSLRWTRQEEFTWAYFRPAAVIDIEASLNDQGAITSWYFININSGRSAAEAPYRIGKAQARYLGSKPPLRQGSYRALSATANNFARESFMDELAQAAGADPLAFRLAHLEDVRLRAVLETAAQRFQWRDKIQQKQPNTGVGLACGTEKGSYVAACAEVAIDRQRKEIQVRRVCEVFECGAVLNPDNLVAQVQSCILMGMGPALREEMRFAQGQMRNAAFSQYLVPRLADVPELDIHLLDRPDLPSVGGGETPIIAIAPAIANAVCHATGLRIRQMPIKLSAAREG